LAFPFSISLADYPADEIPQAPDEGNLVFLPFLRGSGSGPSLPGNGILTNHQSLALFNSIPDSYIQAASRMTLIFWHASVGNNIDNGLDCLMDKIHPRPYSCDRDLLPDQIIYNSKYDRDNWVFEFHQPPPAQNPGWWDKVFLFVDRVDGFGTGQDYDVVSYKFGYVDGLPGSLIDDRFFNNISNDPYPSIEDLEALQTRHPGKFVMLWTMGLARLATPDARSFNQSMRSYANSHEKILVDIADIESHRPDGSACYDNSSQNIEALCDEYTDEINGGHLNALGMQRMAKALWIAMARVAGWNGNP
jgi:hypothetical protein